MKAIKPKTCKVCKSKFTSFQPMAKVCSPGCALTLAVSNRGKAEKIAQIKDKRETKVKLEKLKSRSDWAKEAQAAFNTWVRTRDAELPCISCGRHHQGQYHAGHYLSVGARPELRFEPLNVHKQCAPCNNHFSGNVLLYRKGLLIKVGADVVDWLEGPHPLNHYTTDELIAIKKTYNANTKFLKDAQA